METKYCVVISDDQGHRSIAVKDENGNPFETITAAESYSESLRAVFPKFKYETAPIKGTSKSFFERHFVGDPPYPECFSCSKTSEHDCANCTVHEVAK